MHGTGTKIELHIKRTEPRVLNTPDLLHTNL